MEDNIKISILCIAYNHEKFIRECLDGFIMQKTNFKYEVIIHDDASTDKTAAIIREYEKQYPNIIKPIYQTENQYSKKIPIFVEYLYPRVRGKYIAICEGDDYWIDPYKLQRQFDFLENNVGYSAVFSNTLIRDERETPIKESLTKMYKREYDLFDVLSGTMFGLQNICIRKEVLFDTSIRDVKANGDLKIYYLCALYGKIYRLNGIHAVYRLTGKGIASSRTKSEQLIAEIRERYEFHKQLNFPMSKALVYSQVKIILTFVKNNGYKNVPFSQLKRYLINNPLLYLYYMMYFIIISIKIKLIAAFNIHSVVKPL